MYSISLLIYIYLFHSPSTDPPTDPPTDTSTDPSTDPPTELCDCSRCCSFSSCCDDCYCYYSEYSGSALQNAFKIQVSVTPHQHTLFIHAQQAVAELWLVLCIYCVRCACMVVKCALFICLLCAGLIYHSHTRRCTDTTGMARTWLHRMWYISTSFAHGTEEDKEVDYAFKLLNVASEKHIQTLCMASFKRKQLWAPFIYICIISCFLSAQSLSACSSCELCFRWWRTWDHLKWK